MQSGPRKEWLCSEGDFPGASILPYPSVDISKVKLAMKIGGEYRLRNIGLRHWQKLATALRLDDAELIDRIRAMVQALPD